MGWLMLLLIALATAAALWAMRYPRKLWSIPATALLLGAAGYAWQGRPGLAGHPVEAKPQIGDTDPELIALRDAMFGKFGTIAWTYAMAADRMAADGSPDLSLAVWQGAVRKYPNEISLWTGFGLALSEHDGMQISPAAKFAFDKAIALWPQHPGPPFFYGLALVRAGRYAEARPYWAKAVALTPKGASYSAQLQTRLYLLDQLLVTQKAEQGAR